jgi:hypothetical protein
METLIDALGTQVALGFKGTEKEIQDEYYSLWLHKVFVDVNPHVISPNFIWGWTTKHRLLKGYVNRELNRLAEKHGIEFEGDSIIKKLYKQGEEWLKDLKDNHVEQFLYNANPTKTFTNDYYLCHENRQHKRNYELADVGGSNFRA